MFFNNKKIEFLISILLIIDNLALKAIWENLKNYFIINNVCVKKYIAF